MDLRFDELTDKQRDQARAMFLDAGTVRDDYWYYVDCCGSVMCRNKRNPDLSLPHAEDEQEYLEIPRFLRRGID